MESPEEKTKRLQAASDVLKGRRKTDSLQDAHNRIEALESLVLEALSFGSSIVSGVKAAVKKGGKK